ncbi:MAG TPA: amidohydrolase [Thermomicrobiales bacterium]|nr:amidohydrolase [Thermomicrobiales bacterium]
MPYRSLAPDLILVNGRVHTMDANDMTTSAVAIKDGRVVAVGSDVEVRALAGFGTATEDLGGKTVIPGLIDAHNHLLMTGQALNQIQLYDCRSIDAVLQRVADRSRKTGPGQWILGRGWDESLLAERRHPTRHDLDRVAPDRPVVIHRVWNKLVANSAALRAAGIGRETPDPPADVLYAGSFERDGNGEPTGLFRDRAKELILDHVPAPTEEDFVHAIAMACRAYNAVGLTGVAEPGLYPHEIRAFHRARRADRLTVRVELLMAGWGFGRAEDERFLKDRFTAVGVEGGFGDELLRLEGIKFMPDGGVGDRTARMFTPYLNEPDNRGTWVVEPNRLTELIRWVHDLGWSIDTHTCGDEAQETVVRAYAAAQEANPNPRLRHRVHHAYFPTAAALRLMARHKIPAVVSNPFIVNLGESFVVSLGEERAARAMPMRTYLDAGIPLAGSSDSSVSDYNPWIGMYGAVARTTVNGRVLGPEERITAREALRSYTIGGAYATGLEGIKGSIELGKLADLVVLPHDPLAVSAEELRATKPAATMVGGRWVFDSP